MAAKKCIFILLFNLISCLILAQSKTSILTSICIQHAKTYRHILDADIRIETLDNNNKVLHAESMTSAVFVSKHFEPNQKYNINVQKEGFYPLDTTLVLQENNRSRKQRLGIPLYPIICYYVRGNLLDVSTNKNIATSKITVKNLSTKEELSVEFNNGVYQFCGQCKEKYQINVAASGYFDGQKNLSLDAQNCIGLKEQYMTLDIPLAKSYDKAFFDGDSISVNNFTFVGNSTQLTKQGEQELKKLVLVMLEMPNLLFSIAIQAAPFPERRLNRKLAEQRARLIDKKLIAGGVKPHRYLLVCSTKISASNQKQKILLWLRK